jgi:PKD repeat protein
MRWTLSVALAVTSLGATAACAAPSPSDFYVATSGSDVWSGTLAYPDPGGTDGPFAAIPRAQQAVRNLMVQQPGRATPIVVSIDGGVYYLDATLEFTPADSGTLQAPIIYQAYDRDSPPLISGGVRLEGFAQTADGHWQLTVPGVATGEWTFCQLFVNGHRRFRPRLPKDSYHFIDGALPPTPANEDRGFDRFQFAPGDIRANWHNLNDVEVLVFHYWLMDRLRIASVDEFERAVTFTGPTLAPVAPWWDLAEGRRYIVENVREALSEPGEWYLDNNTGVLTYIPMPGEGLAESVIIAPRLDRLVQFSGNAGAGAWVENITFRDLAFAHTNWVIPSQGYVWWQAESILPGAIVATGTRNCAFEGCTVKQVGDYAIELAGGCRDNRVEDCDLTDLGAGGVKIGEMEIPADTANAARGNVVRDCSITHGGRIHPAAVGVWVGQSPDNRIEHNEIWDFYYSGLSLGWTWGYGPSLCSNNAVEYNNVHLIGQQVLSDMGGIYTLGPSPGTAIRCNRFYDVSGFYYGGWGIYFDEGSSDIVAENNLVYNTRGGGFHQHYGQNNRVTNNILAFDALQQVARTRSEDHLSLTFDHNIVYYEQGSLLGGDWTWTGGNYALDYNCYWDASGGPVTFDGLTLDQWRNERGQDLNSLIADPLFVDPAQYDFALQPGSPALGLGFQPFDLSTAGRTTAPRDPLTTEPLPRAFPEAPPPRPIVDDFEYTRVGQGPRRAIVWEENAQATVRVTDETASSGVHSLKFIDGPGQTYEFNPHIYYVPEAGLSEGLLSGSFAWRLEAGAYGVHEWRDWPTGLPYATGPSLWMRTDGWAWAGGEQLFQIPYGTWMHFVIVCGTGDLADGKWALIADWPGLAAPLRFDDLPCDADFRTLSWYGWSGMATWDATFYIDNINLRQTSTPLVDFSALPTCGPAPLTVSFTDLSAAQPTSWLWSFGDGGGSSQQDPSHGYTEVGYYTVSLTASGAEGSSSREKERHIWVAFPDVPLLPPPQHWSALEVIACATDNIVAGYPDGLYRPDIQVTRAQMAVYVARGLVTPSGDAAIPDPGPPTFTDVPADHWAYRHIEYAASHGVVQGYPDGSYRPASTVDRGQMAVYVARATAAPPGDAGIPSPEPPPTFADVSADHWAYRHIEYAASRGIVPGYPEGYYRPQIVVTRDQMAVYIARGFGLML